MAASQLEATEPGTSQGNAEEDFPLETSLCTLLAMLLTPAAPSTINSSRKILCNQ